MKFILENPGSNSLACPESDKFTGTITQAILGKPECSNGFLTLT